MIGDFTTNSSEAYRTQSVAALNKAFRYYDEVDAYDKTIISLESNNEMLLVSYYKNERRKSANKAFFYAHSYCRWIDNYHSNERLIRRQYI